MDKFLSIFLFKASNQESNKIVNNSENITKTRNRSATQTENKLPKIVTPISRKNSTTDDLSITKFEYKERKTLKYFKEQNFSRENYSYNMLSSINCWPDEILLYLEILRLAYLDFINFYNLNANMFDVAIKNAAYFMFQSNYSKLPNIAAYIKYGDYKIPNNYWIHVVNEDNCYMHELEDRVRSPNEHKHYLLFKALKELIELVPIKDDDNILKKEYEDLIKIFISIYHLKNAYAIVDDICRNILDACIKNNDVELSLQKIFKDIIVDINTVILYYSRKSNDQHLINSIYIFQNIILHGLYTTTQFQFVFNLRRTDINNDQTNNLTPFTSPEYNLLFKNDTISNIEYVYTYFLKILNTKNYKNKIISEINDFEIIQKEINKLNLERPSIAIKHERLISDNTNNIIDLKQNINKNDKYKIDVLVTPRKYVDLDYNPNGTLIKK